jgi:hypothetical protein
MTNTPGLPVSCALIALLALLEFDCGAQAAAAAPAITMLNMTVTLDEVAPGQPGKIGGVDRLRIVYDANAVDPKTRRVKLLNLQHFMDGRYSPPSPDSAAMPMDDSWLDMTVIPYRLHYRASVVHGRPIIIEFDEDTRRLTIRPQSDSTTILESGLYTIDPTRITGPQAIAAGSSPLGTQGDIPRTEPATK